MNIFSNKTVNIGLTHSAHDHHDEGTTDMSASETVWFIKVFLRSMAHNKMYQALIEIILVSMFNSLLILALPLKFLTKKIISIEFH